MKIGCVSLVDRMIEDPPQSDLYYMPIRYWCLFGETHWDKLLRK